MITLAEMKNLAMLSRIEMSDEELLAMAHEFDSILAYVDQISNVQVSDITDVELQKNVTHADANPYASGTYSETMIQGAPDSMDGFYKVPKIL